MGYRNVEQEHSGSRTSLQGVDRSTEQEQEQSNGSVRREAKGGGRSQYIAGAERGRAEQSNGSANEEGVRVRAVAVCSKNIVGQSRATEPYRGRRRKGAPRRGRVLVLHPMVAVTRKIAKPPQENPRLFVSENLLGKCHKRTICSLHRQQNAKKHRGQEVEKLL